MSRPFPYRANWRTVRERWTVPQLRSVGRFRTRQTTRLRSIQPATHQRQTNSVEECSSSEVRGLRGFSEGTRRPPQVMQLSELPCLRGMRFGCRAVFSTCEPDLFNFGFLFARVLCGLDRETPLTFQPPPVCQNGTFPIIGSFPPMGKPRVGPPGGYGRTAGPPDSRIFVPEDFKLS